MRVLVGGCLLKVDSVVGVKVDYFATAGGVDCAGIDYNVYVCAYAEQLEG